MDATPASTDTNKVIIPNDFWFLSHLQPCASGSRGSAGLGKARACDGKRLNDYDKVCWQHDDEMDSVRSACMAHYFDLKTCAVFFDGRVCGGKMTSTPWLEGIEAMVDRRS